MPTLRVLLVDNNPENSGRVAGLLEQASHAVLPAADLHEATLALDLQQFDAVIVASQVMSEDLLAFRKDLARVEQNSRPPVRIPVVCYTTGSAHSPSTADLARYQVDAVLPSNFEELAFSQLMNNLAARLSSHSPDGSSVSMPVFDSAEFAEQVGFDPDLIVEIIDLFLSDCDVQVMSMLTILANNDLLTLSRLAHSLKGSLASLYARPSAASAQRLETAGKVGDREGSTTALTALERDLAALKPQLIAFRNAQSGS